MLKSRSYPVANRLMVYVGLAVIGAAMFPPSLIVSVPTVAAWYRGARRLETNARQSVILHRMNAEYDRAIKSFMS